MEPLYFVIAILGCGEGDAPCQAVRTLDARYETSAACTAATDAAVMEHNDADYPVIVAQCVRSGGPAETVKGSEIELPAPGKAQVRVSPLRS